MKAVGNNILFKYKDDGMTEGGIFLTKGADANATALEVEVISVGSLVQYVKKGDKILIPKLMKTPVDLEEGIYSTLESQVLAILES